VLVCAKAGAASAALSAIAAVNERRLFIISVLFLPCKMPCDRHSI
jgi:hypothetical protein